MENSLTSSLDELEKMKKRQSRFGLVESNSLLAKEELKKKLQDRKDRFHLTSTSEIGGQSNDSDKDLDGKLKERELRFTSAQDKEETDKKMKRALRFQTSNPI